MSKLIVGQIVARAAADINLAKSEASLPENHRKAQDAFRNSALLQGQESLAELYSLITGFRPRASNSRINPFQCFVELSKAETRPIKIALVMASCGGAAWGCTGLNEPAVRFVAETCRLATEEEAEQFITVEVTGWEDKSVIAWVQKNMGAEQVVPFFAELDRNSVATVAASHKK